MHWRTLEEKVCALASLHWLGVARPEHVDGVNFDCVVRAANGDVILIEVTKERDLDKTRTDISKIAPVRMNHLVRGQVCRAFIVMDSVPTNSMTELGEKSHVNVLSIDDFEKLFFDYKAYVSLRTAHEFGSAIDQNTGKNDETPYVRVSYQDKKLLVGTDIDKIKRKLVNGEHVVLTGDFGTGKSRCVKELFLSLAHAATSNIGPYVLAINLRDHWGARSTSEIIVGHLEAIGLSASVDNAIRLLNAGYLIVLLDGFDEVGAQTFGRSFEHRKAVRMEALRGVRDVVSRSKGGALIAGRSHYFDSDTELMEAFGLGHVERSCLIECASEFSQSEARDYLLARGIAAKIPSWLPKKPLVFQIVSVLPDEATNKLFEHVLGEFIFWGTFSTMICDREAKIHSSLDSRSIYSLLIEIARRTRLSNSVVGELTTKDLSLAYEKVVGESPDDAGNLMLMRLCTLGRISTESADRQFIDPYIADGFRGTGLIRIIESQQFELIEPNWRQPLRKLGLSLISTAMERDNSHNLFIAAVQKLSGDIHAQAMSEIAAALTFSSIGASVDLKGCVLRDAHIESIIFGNTTTLLNATFDNCIFDFVFFEPNDYRASDHARVENCLIGDVFGVGGKAGLPSFIKDSSVNVYESVSNASKIKSAGLPASQTLALAILHKIFFQPGAGRKEAALYKGGFGKNADAQMVDKILRLLMSEGVIHRSRGDDGYIYHANHHLQRRIQKIKAELDLCDDPLWKKLKLIN